MGFRSLAEVQAFVRSLDVPEERRDVVEAELLDHFFARVADGIEESDALAAFGSEDALRTRFEVVESGFEITRRDAIHDGLRVSAAWLVASALAWLVYGAAFGVGMDQFLFFTEASRVDANGVVVHAALLVVGCLLSLRARHPAAAGRVHMGGDALFAFFLAACVGPVLSMSGLWIAAMTSIANTLVGMNTSIVEGVYGSVSAFLAGPLIALLATWRYRATLFPALSSRPRTRINA